MSSHITTTRWPHAPCFEERECDVFDLPVNLEWGARGEDILLQI